VTGTFSKAYGLAGARVGWAIAPGPREAELLRAAGGACPVAGPSLAAALVAFEDRPALRDSVALVARERESIEDAMTRAGFAAGTSRSRANFAFRRAVDAPGFARALLDRGFAIRIFPGREGTVDAVRVSCPQDSGALEKLVAAIAEAGARLAATGSGA
jgi:histidinol-phosphate aminotransferase